MSQKYYPELVEKYLKEQGIVHRDLKLGNLFLDGDM
jgi:serine/threonine protein kinase